MPFSFDPPPEDNEIECARCGAYFYYGLSHCPECEVNIYEPDDETDEEYNDKIVDGLRSQGNFVSNVRKIFRRITGKPYTAEEVFGDSLDQAILYNDLLGKVRGDHSAADRLIEFERQQMPSGTRITWLKTAIERWERDNQIKGSSP